MNVNETFDVSLGFTAAPWSILNNSAIRNLFHKNLLFVKRNILHKPC